MRTIVTSSLCVALLVGCGDGSSPSSTGESSGSSSGDTETSGMATTEDETTTDTSSEGTESTATDSSSTAADTTTGGPVETPSCDELPAFIAAFKDSHGGNGGMDWDINQMTPAEVAADPEARALFALCGDDQRPVIPQLAWEYGGSDHQWVAPEASALFYCVYTPANPATKHWSFDERAQLVTADVTIGCPDQNPCNAETGADQVLMCLGDPTNIEIIVDTASYDDGHGAGLELSEAATDLYLLFEDGSRVFLVNVP